MKNESAGENMNDMKDLDLKAILFQGTHRPRNLVPVDAADQLYDCTVNRFPPIMQWFVFSEVLILQLYVQKCCPFFLV